MEILHEKQLVEELKRGSYKAFTQLHEIYSARLYGFVFNTLKSRTQTSDIVQETFIRIWENRATINAEQSFKSFIFTIAHNLLISEYRKQINKPELMEYIEFSNSSDYPDYSTLHQIDLDEFMLRLEKAKLQLSPRQKEIFELIKEYGMTSVQVSERLGISEQVVRNQLSLSLKTLKKALTDYLVLFLFFFAR